MQKKILKIAIIICLTGVVACNENSTAGNSTDTAKAPAATDTMPVLRPGNFDSSSSVKTPSTNDHNVIVPDTTRAVKQARKKLL